MTSTPDAANDFFRGDGGFKDIMLKLKKVQKKGVLPEESLNNCAVVQESMEEELKEAMVSYARGAHNCSKYIALNSGEFNMAEGDDCIDGMAKAVAGYEWMKRNDKGDFNTPSDLPYCNAEPYSDEAE